MKTESDELACTYASLILADADVTINPQNIITLTQHVGISVAPFWPNLFTRLLKDKSIEDIVFSAGSAPTQSTGSSSTGGGSTVASKVEDVPEEKEEEKPEEKAESDNMGFSFFDE